MGTDLNFGPSGKSGGDAFGHAHGGSSGIGGMGAGSASAGGFGASLNQAESSGTGGDGYSSAISRGALGGEAADNTAIGSINISF